MAKKVDKQKDTFSNGDSKPEGEGVLKPEDPAQEQNTDLGEMPPLPLTSASTDEEFEAALAEQSQDTSKPDEPDLNAEPPAVDEPEVKVDLDDAAPKKRSNKVGIVVDNHAVPAQISTSEFLVSFDRKLPTETEIKAEGHSHKFKAIFVGPGYFTEHDPNQQAFPHMLVATNAKNPFQTGKNFELGTKFYVQ